MPSARATAVVLATILTAALPAHTASPLNLTVLGRADVSPGADGYFDALAVHDDRVYFLERHDAGGSFDSWVNIYDLSDPSTPVLLSRTPFTGRIADMHGIHYANGLLYFGSQGSGGGLHIWDVADPRNPVALGTADPRAPTLPYRSNGVHNLRRAGGWLYLLPNGDDPEIAVVDVSDPSNPSVVNEFQLYPDPAAAFCHDLTAMAGIGYASCWDDGLFLFDLSDPTVSPLPILRSTVTGENTHSAWPSTDLGSVLTCQERRNEPVRVWDLGPTPFAEVASWRSTEAGPDNIVHDVMVVGDFAYVSHYGEGMRILDIRDRTAPVEVGSYQSGPGCGANYCDGIAQWVEDGLVYYLDMVNGLYVFRFDLPHDAPIRVLAVKSGAGRNVTLSWNHTGESQYSIRERLVKETLTGCRTSDVDSELSWTGTGAVPATPALVFYTVNGRWTGTP